MLFEVMACFPPQEAAGVWAFLTDTEAVQLETCSKELLAGTDVTESARACSYYSS